MSWKIYIRGKAEKRLKRLPGKDSERIKLTIDEIAENPYGGDVEKMGGEENTWRRRVGAYRIKYEIFPKENFIHVFEMERRTSNTY